MHRWVSQIASQIVSKRPLRQRRKQSKRTVEVTPTQRRTYTLLFEAMREHVFIYIRPVTSKKSYQSVILDLNPHEQYILIDELFPSEGFQLVMNDQLEVSIGKKGNVMTFMTELQMAGEYAGTPFYKLALPELVEQQQRRRSYRIEMDQDRYSYAQWGGAGGRQCRAKLMDLSSGGVRMEVLEGGETVIPGMILPSVMLYIGSDLKVSCDVEVKYIAEHEGDRALIGGEIIATEANGQALQRYLQKMQRVNRRRQLAAQ